MMDSYQSMALAMPLRHIIEMRHAHKACLTRGMKPLFVDEQFLLYESKFRKSAP